MSSPGHTRQGTTVLRRLAARLARRLPAGVQEVAATARSRFVEGPTVGLPDISRLLVVAPHPDDETIACGGTSARVRDAGGQVRVLVVTDGTASAGGDLSRDRVATARREETRRACAILGVGEPRFLGLPDGALRTAVDDLAAALADAVTGFDPDVIILPSPFDDHRDHRAANEALAEVPMRDDVEIWGGEVWTPVPASRIVDITASIDRKRAALREHTTARETLDVDAFVGLNRYRALHGLRGRGHAEAYLALPSRAYLEVVTSTSAGR